MATSGLPFDDIRELFVLLPPAAETCVEDVRARQAELVKPANSLGRVEQLVEWLAAWQARSRPTVAQPLVAIFAATHGVAAQSVSNYPQALTRAMLETYAAGGGAVNQICASFGLGLKAFELALDLPTPDITHAAAFDEAACAATIAFGMEAVAGGADLLCLGHSGVGGPTVAAAVLHALYGGAAFQWVADDGDDALRARRIAAVETAVALNHGHLADPLEILRRLGGRDIAACVGAILSARMERVPVILDGIVVTAAACVLDAAAPGSADHCLAGHVAPGGAHARALARLNKTPLLDLGISMGEGAGAALAAGIVKAALACFNEMATRTQANAPGRVN